MGGTVKGGVPGAWELCNFYILVEKSKFSKEQVW